MCECIMILLYVKEGKEEEEREAREEKKVGVTPCVCVCVNVWMGVYVILSVSTVMASDVFDSDDTEKFVDKVMWRQSERGSFYLAEVHLLFFIGRSPRSASHDSVP